MPSIVRAIAASVAAASVLWAGAASAVSALPKLRIDRTNITVSGMSSGAFMAVQLGYAYAATFKGVGVFAGGPYMCGGHADYPACMYDATISGAMLATMQKDIDAWSGVQNDAKANVANQRIYLFVGSSDKTVGPHPMAAVREQYARNGVAAANLQSVTRPGTAHNFPTDFAGAGDNACGRSTSPYIGNCGYDGAKAALTMFYGTLAARNDAPAAARYIPFDQTAFTTNPGMAATGWVYVPANCAAGAVCKLHVALHGCLQNEATIGDRFLKNTGYTRWADTNGIVVLFPQTRVDHAIHATAASGFLPNPDGCWDWIGWYGTNFAQKAGTQAAAIKAMVDELSSGHGGPAGSLPAPGGVTTSGATATTMTISWNAVGGAASYDVYRDDVRVDASTVTGSTYTDTGLASGTTYGWSVAAVDANGAEGALSATVKGSTTGAAPRCYTASNYDHTTAGRAHAIWGIAYANGSDQIMGPWNVFVTTTLKRTGPNDYVIGTCP